MKENKELEVLTAHFSKKLEAEEKGIQVYETLLQSYGLAGYEIETNTYEGETVTECKLGIGKAVLEADDYPDYYGGAFINDEGKLVIYVVGDLVEAQAKVAKVIENDEAYVLKQALYSYKELLELKETFDFLEKTDEQVEVFANVTAYGPLEKDNLLMVEMNVLDQAKISQFKAFVSDSDMIVFRQGEFIENQATVHPGQGVFNPQNGRSTLTTRARQNSGNGPVGFIMSGHGVNQVGHTIRNGSAANATVLGQVTLRQWSGNIDAAFCQRTNNAVSLSDQIFQNGLALGPSITTAPVGTSVFIAGSSSGVQTGTVAATNLTVSVSGVVMNGLSRASYSSQGGDSGGPIYRTISGVRPIAGNHIASNGHFGLISPILNQFNLRLTE
ncbi:MAG: S1 family peptidase [Defluviitaleaceae bacterium]|nr:S1 family peptidase [Defluviitaleaceae bacterium]